MLETLIANVPPAGAIESKRWKSNRIGSDLSGFVLGT
jgi:hypothetical protein